MSAAFNASSARGCAHSAAGAKQRIEPARLVDLAARDQVFQMRADRRGLRMLRRRVAAERGAQRIDRPCDERPRQGRHRRAPAAAAPRARARHRARAPPACASPRMKRPPMRCTPWAISAARRSSICGSAPWARRRWPPGGRWPRPRRRRDPAGSGARRPRPCSASASRAASPRPRRAAVVELWGDGWWQQVGGAAQAIELRAGGVGR